MTDVYTTAVWVPKQGHEREFEEAWNVFASWARSMPGAHTLRLSRDTTDESRYVSFGRWDSLDAAHAWKSSPDFGSRMAQVQQHVDLFTPSELEVVRTVAEPQPA